MATPSEGKQHRKTSRPGQSAEDSIRLQLCVCVWVFVCMTCVFFLLQGGQRRVRSLSHLSQNTCDLQAEPVIKR